MHVKTFVKPSKVKSMLTPHTYNINGIAQNINKEVMTPHPFVNNDIDYNLAPAYIAHYIFQSEEMYRFRRINRVSDDLGQVRNFDDKFHTYYNEVENTSVKEKYSEKIENYLKEHEL